MQKHGTWNGTTVCPFFQSSPLHHLPFALFVVLLTNNDDVPPSSLYILVSPSRLFLITVNQLNRQYCFSDLNISTEFIAHVLGILLCCVCCSCGPWVGAIRGYGEGDAAFTMADTKNGREGEKEDEEDGEDNGCC